MASYQYLNTSHHPRNSCSTHTRRAYSKAQMCFFNILHIISSIPPSPNTKPQPCPGPADDRSASSRSGNQGIDIDLNMRLCSEADTGESESFGDNGSDSSAIEGNRGGGEVREKGVEILEATDVQVQSFKVDDNGVDHEEAKSEEDISVESERFRKGNEGCDGGGAETAAFARKRRKEGKGSYNNCLDLLIEAAKLVSAKDESDSDEASGDRGLSGELRTGRASGVLDLEVQVPMKKRKQRWVVVDLCSDAEESSQVVRSKRGRSQALPYRFRDSVVEPLKRSGRSHRPSASTAAPRKRLIGS